MRIERTAVRTAALTAARASSLALFRELFPAEVLSPGQLATVSIITLLAIDLDPAQADALYRELGDARAFNVVHELFRLLDEAVREAGGAPWSRPSARACSPPSTIPPPPSGSAFSSSAVWRPSEPTRNLTLRPAIQRGKALATNVNDHLDYFGTITRQVHRLTDQIEPGEMALAPDVAGGPRSRRTARGPGIEPEVVTPGRSGLPYLIRIRLRE